jgi:hypothetical protein
MLRNPKTSKASFGLGVLASIIKRVLGVKTALHRV